MQELILILSRCKARRQSHKTQKKFYRFNFKGFYSGLKIKEIWIHSDEESQLEIGEDYLIWVKPNTIKDAVLDVRLIKFKKIT